MSHDPALSDRTAGRLLDAAIQVFAERGYDKSSTREICRLAQANVAAIHYHFGDKAGLYREVLRAGLNRLEDPFEPERLTRRATLLRFYRFLLAPLAGSELHQRLIRIHIREELEPTGVLDDTGARAILPRHRKLTAFLAREIGAARPDLEIERLAFSLLGIGAIFYHLRGEIGAIEARLVTPGRALDIAAERLSAYAEVLIEAEAARRRASARGAAT